MSLGDAFKGLRLPFPPESTGSFAADVRQMLLADRVSLQGAIAGRDLREAARLIGMTELLQHKTRSWPARFRAMMLAVEVEMLCARDPGIKRDSVIVDVANRRKLHRKTVDNALKRYREAARQAIENKDHT